MTKTMRDRQTIEMPVVSDADLLAELVTGPVPAPLRSWDERCDLAVTQELRIVPETRPASQWSPSALDRLLADVRGETKATSGEFCVLIDVRGEVQS